MELRFDGKAALVTGASTGIGAAIAAALGASGAKVAVHYNRSRAEAEKTAAAIRGGGAEALLVQADLTDVRQAERLARTVADAFGRIDILVNNAGGLLDRRPVARMSDEDFDRVMELNIGSAFRVSRAVIPVMEKTGGAIINLSSIAARNGGADGATLYAAAKAAVSTFTRGLARELAPLGIRVNAIAPGIILTPFHDKYTPPDLLAKMIAPIPLGRAASAEEVAGPALFLASEQLSSFITGEVIEVNGGALMA
jgi:3-oxoacyl-[acyl-carrier protein] reductase